MKRRWKSTLFPVLAAWAVWACAKSDSPRQEIAMYPLDREALAKDPPEVTAGPEPVTGIAFLSFDPESDTIDFKLSGGQVKYRQPFLLEKGEARLTFCFDSPFFSSSTPLWKQMDAVFWHPPLESQFGKKPDYSGTLTAKVVFHGEEFKTVLKKILTR